MSARHDDFDRLVDGLQLYDDIWNAPYGIIEGQQNGAAAGSVVAYTVTFGCSATVDAEVLVYSTSRIVLKSRGRMEHLNGSYKSVDHLLVALNKFAHGKA